MNNSTYRKNNYKKNYYKKNYSNNQSYNSNYYNPNYYNPNNQSYNSNHYNPNNQYYYPNNPNHYNPNNQYYYPDNQYYYPLTQDSIANNNDLFTRKPKQTSIILEDLIKQNMEYNKLQQDIDKKTCFKPDSDLKLDSDPKLETTFCLNPHDEYEELDLKLDSLESLIELGKKYDEKTAHKYSINLKKLNLLIPTLEKLNNMIGISNVKKNIVNQIVYFMSGLETQDNMLHTVITGPPGVGKTALGHIIGEIYFKLDILKSSNNTDKYIFKVARRSDLIAQYLGQTAIKTQKVIDDCIGGVLFIDEAYSLGSGGNSDIYSKECIDTLNQNLTENKNFVCIIAGYTDQLEKNFFSVNSGLKRRFPFTYTINKYNAGELSQIFNLKMTEHSWIFDNLNMNNHELFKNFISKKYDDFPYFGGDMETLFLNVKIAHALRIVGKHPSIRKKINIQDIESGFDMFKNAKMVSKDVMSESLRYIYM